MRHLTRLFSALLAWLDISNEEMNLLDLPLLLLACIVALTSKGEPCEYGLFSFQIIGYSEPIKLLYPLVTCCRQLRNACRLALGGVEDTVVADDVVIPFLRRPDRIFLHSILSLPCLAELSFFRSGISKGAAIQLVQQTTNLKKLEICKVREIDWLEITQFPSHRTLKTLALELLSEEETNHILSFPYKSLTDVHLLCSDYVPVIPLHVVRTPRTFTIPSPSGNDNRRKRDLTLSLTSATFLTHFHVDCDISETPRELPNRNSFRNLKTLLFHDCRDPDLYDFELFAEAGREGRFPVLQELHISCSDSESLYPIAWVGSVSKACRQTLRVLKTETKLPPSQEHVEELNDVLDDARLRSAFELKLCIGMFDHNSSQEYRVTPLLKAGRYLVGVRLSYGKFRFLLELGKLPRLRTAKFYRCSLKQFDVDRLIEQAGKLESLRFEKCLAGNYTLAWLDYSWNSLTRD